MDEDGAEFTEGQATDFLEKHEVAYHYPNDDTGLTLQYLKKKPQEN